LVEAQGHYFIAADNGIFNLVLNSDPDRIIKLDNKTGDKTSGELEIFANAASIIAAGKNIEEAGKPVETLQEKVPIRATIEEGAISGSIIFIDSYGNAVSNITRDVFTRVFKKKNFRIAIRSNTNIIDHISKSYNSETIGDLLAIFNSLGLLEIGINGTDASELLSIQVGDVARVDTPGSNKKPGTLF
jgi:S-adenosylmethionine hydrolase